MEFHGEKERKKKAKNFQLFFINRGISCKYIERCKCARELSSDFEKAPRPSEWNLSTISFEQRLCEFFVASRNINTTTFDAVMVNPFEKQIPEKIALF